MQSLKDIKNRLNTIQIINKITQTMKLVSVSKFKTSLSLLHNLTHFIRTFNKMKLNVFHNSNLESMQYYFSYQYLKSFSSNELLIAISSNKKLCGSFNIKINNMIINKVQNSPNCKIITLGKQVENFVKKKYFSNFATSYEILFKNHEINNFLLISKKILSFLSKGRFNSCNIIYTRFVSPLKQETVSESISSCSIENKDFSNIYSILNLDNSLTSIISHITAKFLSSNLLYCLVNSYISEHSSRMISMDSASSNASNLIDNLKRIYHKNRQNAITKELLEITSGFESIKNI